MSEELNFDFLDGSPTTQLDAPRGTVTNQNRFGASIIRIPESQEQKSSKLPEQSTSQGISLFQGLIQNATKFGSNSDMSENDRQILIATSRQKQQQNPKTTTGNFNWCLNYLSQYFDVTTTDVVERILWSAIPMRKKGIDIDTLDDTAELMEPLSGDADSTSFDKDNGKKYSRSRERSYSYMERFILSRPDFYGPFWISTTLVFVVAILSNVMSFVEYNSKMEKINLAISMASSDNKSQKLVFDQIQPQIEEWHYSMDELNLTSSLVMLYITLVPISMWCLFWFRGCSKTYTLTETICAYGYALSVFIPLAVILTIQTSLVRYSVIALVTALSSFVLVLSFLPVVKSDPNPKSSHMILALVPVYQFSLAYFIHRIMLQ